MSNIYCKRCYRKVKIDSEETVTLMKFVMMYPQQHPRPDFDGSMSLTCDRCGRTFSIDDIRPGEDEDINRFDLMDI